MPNAPLSPADPAKTREVIALLATPRASRDAAWIESFYARIPDAALSRGGGAATLGPDGFPYLPLRTSGQIERGDVLTSLRAAAVDCTDAGWGVVLDPAGTDVQWVFKYGDLWSLREYGGFAGDGVESAEDGIPGGKRNFVVRKETQVIVSSPSAKFFPPYARRAFRDFLTRSLGIKTPRVALMLDPQSKPGRNLVFNVFREDFSPATLDNAMRRLSQWYLPPGIAVTVVPKAHSDWVRDPL